MTWLSEEEKDLIRKHYPKYGAKGIVKRDILHAVG